MMKYVLIFFIFTASLFSSTKAIEGEVTGRSYNDIVKKWLEFKIIAYVDNKANVYLATTYGLKPSVFVARSKYTALIEALEKGLKWHKVSKEKKLEATKPLIDLTYEGKLQKAGLSIKFFTANKGQQTDFILEMIDFDNQFKKATLYLNEENSIKLLEILKKAPATYKQLLKNEKDAEALK